MSENVTVPTRQLGPIAGLLFSNPLVLIVSVAMLGLLGWLIGAKIGILPSLTAENLIFLGLVGFIIGIILGKIPLNKITMAMAIVLVVIIIFFVVFKVR